MQTRIYMYDEPGLVGSVAPVKVLRQPGACTPLAGFLLRFS